VLFLRFNAFIKGIPPSFCGGGSLMTSASWAMEKEEPMHRTKPIIKHATTVFLITVLLYSIPAAEYLNFPIVMQHATVSGVEWSRYFLPVSIL
jgi:hypothetical protein